MKAQIFFLTSLATAVVSSPAQAADWPMWGGGTARNMVSSEKVGDLDINPGKKVKGKEEIDMATTKNCKWVVKLGSQAYGTPVISQGKVLVGTNNENPRDTRFKGDRSILLCLNEKTGEMEWQLANPKLGTGKVSDWEYLGMCNTGEVEGNRIYAVTNRCEVVCLDLEGMKNGNDGPFNKEAENLTDKDTKVTEAMPTDADIIWKFDLRGELGVFPHNVTSSNVLVVDDKIFASTSNGVDWTHTNIPAKEAPSLVCIDKKTGALLGEEGSGISKRCLHCSWGSPTLAVKGEQKVVVFGAGDGYCYGYDLTTKKDKEGLDILNELWRIDCNPPEYRTDENGKPRKYASDYKGPSEVIATPIFYNGKIYVQIGQDPEHQEGVGMMSCIDPFQKGEIKPVWTYKELNRSISTASISDGILYAADFSGRVHALDAETGKAFWVYDTKGHIWGSTLVAGGKVIIGNEQGELHVLQAGKEMKHLKTIDFPGALMASPVLANGTLYVMTMSHLFAFKAD